MIDEGALERALLDGTISGAALDVFAVEPPITSNIAHLENVIVTPHIGGSTDNGVRPVSNPGDRLQISLGTWFTLFMSVYIDDLKLLFKEDADSKCSQVDVPDADVDFF